MISALIIDDEESTVNVLKLLLQLHVPEISNIETAIGAASGLHALKESQPDIVFLDIEMPLMSGFELLEQFPNHFFEVIFVTAYDHFAIKAIRYSALDYLLKPVDVEELKLAVQRFISKRTNSQQKELYENLMHNLRSEKESDYKLAISTTEGTFFYKPEEIIRCEADGNYTRFYLRDKKPLIASRTLKEFDEILSEQQFIRVSRGDLVNKKYIVSFSGDHELRLTDNSLIEVSRRRWDFVKKQLVN
ncbi:MAG: LytTR family DNA-binding domain-containing protein [Chitinophagales bacterium]|nr:response regulator transcription factor [Bacteroidota bacterium]MBX7142477.1 LytTR family DNA-binding domain-containing protein [Chitinophagales bacterium]